MPEYCKYMWIKAHYTQIFGVEIWWYVSKLKYKLHKFHVFTIFWHPIQNRIKKANSYASLIIKYLLLLDC